MATPEKSLLDLWHLNSGDWGVDRMQAMRFQNFDAVSVERFGKPRLNAAISAWQQVHVSMETGTALRFVYALPRFSEDLDWYDLLWYLSQRPPMAPNLELMQSALDRTQGTGNFRSADWRGLLLDKVHGLDFSTLLCDVEPFLERPLDARLISAENF